MATPSAAVSSTFESGRSPLDAPGPVQSGHTPDFPALLRQLGASLLVTTYQAGKLVIVPDEGDHLNTHYRSFKSPIGLALADAGARLAIGTTIQVWEYRDVPDIARRLDPGGKHDACYLPRASHVTGNILIHEMAYGSSVAYRSRSGSLPRSGRVAFASWTCAAARRLPCSSSRAVFRKFSPWPCCRGAFPI